MSNHYKILIADDREDNLGLLREWLSAQDYYVRCARDGREALGMARKDPPDLVLVDKVMPEVDGLSVARELKKGDPTVPVIVLTGREDSRRAAIFDDTGADDLRQGIRTRRSRGVARRPLRQHDRKHRRTVQHDSAVGIERRHARGGDPGAHEREHQRDEPREPLHSEPQLSREMTCRWDEPTPAPDLQQWPNGLFGCPKNASEGGCVVGASRLSIRREHPRPLGT